MLKQTLIYCQNEWNKMFSFITVGGFKAFVAKVLMFFWLWWGSYGAYMLVPLLAGTMDCYYDTKVNLFKGEKFDFIRFSKGLLDKLFSFAALLLLVYGIEYVVKKDIHYQGNYLLMAITFIISSHEVGGMCASMSVLHPSWKFVKSISELLGVAQRKIIDKAENILK